MHMSIKKGNTYYVAVSPHIYAAAAIGLQILAQAISSRQWQQATTNRAEVFPWTVLPTIPQLLRT